jgi:ABC-type lipoprotein release transport system permease subunit
MAINIGMVLQRAETALATELGHLQVHAPGFQENPELRVRLTDGGSAATSTLEGISGVRAWAPRLRGQGLVNSPRASLGVSVVAIQPEREVEVSLMADSLVAGRWLDAQRGRVLIGEALARRLQVELGQKIVLSVQDLAGDLTGRPYRVGGVFRTPSRELDQGAVFLRLDEAQQLFGVGQTVSEIVVVAHDRDDIPDLQSALRASLGEDAEAQSWEELRPLLVYLVEMFDASAWYLYAAVFIAMAFGIANVLLMAVYERTREIGMMMAMGMSRRRVIGTVVAESLLVTALGLVLGIAMAALSVFALRGGIDLSMFSEGLTAYGIGTRIVPVLRGGDLAAPLVVAVVASLLASLWPALRAARSRPAEALRHV